MIRHCIESDFETIYEIVNDAARAYRGVVPDHFWHEPYMSRNELTREIKDGTIFWGWEQNGLLHGVMGIQDKSDVSLIRHAYVRTKVRNQGIGTRLLRHMEKETLEPVLIGTWAQATWAIAFYQKNGYQLVLGMEKDRLLKKYWTISKEQIAASVVLADTKYVNREHPEIHIADH